MKLFLSWGNIRDSIRQRILSISPGLILTCFLMLTFFASSATYIFESQLKQTQIEHKIENVTDFIRSNIQSHIDSIIRPTQGLFISSDFVDRKEFDSFAKALQISNVKSGIQGVSYVIRLREADLDSHTKMMKAQGFSDFAIWPDLKQKIGQDYFPVTYIYPMDWRNKRVHGFNVGQEEKMRQAMDWARDTGEPTMTQQVTLVQETSIDLQPGFLIFAPLYNKKMPVSNLEERRRALIGYISGVFRTTNFFDQLMLSVVPNVQSIKLEIYDGDTIDPNQLFYSYSSSEKKEVDIFKGETKFKTVAIEVANRKWLARILTPDVRPVVFEKDLQWFLLIVGLLISLLLYVVSKLNQIQNMKLNQDIEILTETKTYLQEAKESAETASTLKGAFLANMSHEIRTPLSVIISSSNFLMDSQTSSEEKERFVQIIQRNGKNLLGIINDILDFSKIEAGMVALEFVPTSIYSVLKDVESDMQLLAQNKNISFKVNILSELPGDFGTDPGRLQQILRNVIGNAIKFTEQGSVEITVEASKDHEIRFLVKDSGIGLNQEQQKKLFAPFSQADVTFTRKYGGTGLGLVLAKKLARLLGGDVTLKSSDSGIGSVFEIVIKNQSTSAPQNKSIPPDTMVKKQLPFIGKKILLVEDSPDNQFVVTRILQMQGAEVTVAQNGRDGIEKALEENFDLILMDIQMPVMDGVAATKILRQKGYKRPIFALTAHTQPHLKELSTEAGFDNYLNKPFLVDELIRKFNF